MIKCTKPVIGKTFDFADILNSISLSVIFPLVQYFVESESDIKSWVFLGELTASKLFAMNASRTKYLDCSVVVSGRFAV